MPDPTGPGPSEGTRKLAVLWTGSLMAFAAFLGLVAILERIGLPQFLVPPLVFAPTLVAFAALGVAMRTMLFAEFDAAGRAVPLPANVVAIGTTVTGVVVSGVEQLVVGLGCAIGLFAAGLMIAPALRTSGATTLAAFIGRHHGRTARAAGAIVTVGCCLPAAVALVDGASRGISAALAVAPSHAIQAVVAVLFCASVFGGLRGLSAANLVAGAVLVIGAAVAVLFLVLGIPAGSYDRSVAGGGQNALLLALTALIGGFALPPLGQRFASAVSAEEARRAAHWAALFVAVLAFVLPAPSFDRATMFGTSAVGASLLAAAVVAAMLAAAIAFVFAMANTLSNDLHRAFLAPREAASRQLIMARLLVTIAIAAVARLSAEAAIAPPVLVMWTITLAAAGLAPILILRTIMRVGGTAAAIGMAAGTVVPLLNLLGSPYDPMQGSASAAVALGGVTIGLMATAAAALAASFLDSVSGFKSPQALRAGGEELEARCYCTAERRGRGARPQRSVALDARRCRACVASSTVGVLERLST